MAAVDSLIFVWPSCGPAFNLHLSPIHCVMVNQLPSASYSRSVCEIGGKGTEACQIDQGGWTGEVTRQRVLVQWHNNKGGQGVSARGWEGQAAARGREGKQRGGKSKDCLLYKRQGTHKLKKRHAPEVHCSSNSRCTCFLVGRSSPTHVA